tara:strand:+ start:554 stop:769 length:216 start_codon:yes stop_codon:yes gene_type:complete
MEAKRETDNMDLLRKQYDLIEQLLCRVEKLKLKINNMKKKNKRMGKKIKELTEIEETYLTYINNIQYVVWK